MGQWVKGRAGVRHAVHVGQGVSGATPGGVGPRLGRRGKDGKSKGGACAEQERQEQSRATRKCRARSTQQAARASLGYELVLVLGVVQVDCHVAAASRQDAWPVRRAVHQLLHLGSRSSRSSRKVACRVAVLPAWWQKAPTACWWAVGAAHSGAVL